ncbi:MAG: XRE family transcriptional regulator [Oscillospiraceae bacterium]
MKFAESLRKLREQRGITQEDLAKSIGVSKSTISMYENNNREPDFETQEALADYFNVDMNKLMGKQSASGVRIPVLGNVAAGIPLEAIEDILDYEEIPEAWTIQGDFFGLRINGDSMEPRICKGDVVIIRKQEDANTGDIVIATVDGDCAACKKLKKIENGLMLISINANYEPFIYNWQEVEELPVRIIGKVVELRAKF